MAETTIDTAASGDLVRARRDDRDAAFVEGVLYLRYVPPVGYVQVWVGKARVEPETVTVLRRGVVSAEELQRNDPLSKDPQWRRISDLATAARQGLLPRPTVRNGDSWEQLFALADELTAPLLHAGWTVTGRQTETGDASDPGESVILLLARDGRQISIELFDQGRVDLWSEDEASHGADDGEAEPAEPILTIGNATSESCVAGFKAAGWLD